MSFSGDLNKFAAKVQATEDELVRAVVLEMGNSIVDLSPVDTGRFRGNWQHNSDSPAVGNLVTTDKTGSATKSKLQTSTADIKAGGIEYFTNNLPYAIPLEYGHSKVKAPQGMVRRTVARFNIILSEQARSIV